MAIIYFNSKNSNASSDLLSITENEAQNEKVGIVRIIIAGISVKVQDAMNKSGIAQNLISHNGGRGCQY